MKTAHCKLKSVSPYSQSRYHNIPKKDKESSEAHEERTWREKAHYDSDGYVIIPQMAFKQAIDAAAKFLGRQIPGKGKATYTKHFLAGTLITEPIVLPINYQEMDCYQGMMNVDGVRGSGKRVMRKFPEVRQWAGTLTVSILDDTITEEVFEETIQEAGRFIGIGRFRPQSGGFYGRFQVESVTWEEE